MNENKDEILKPDELQEQAAAEESLPELDLNDFADASAPAGDAEKPKKHLGLKIGVIAAGCTLVLLVGAAVGGGYYVLKDGGAFDDTTFYKNTLLNGIDCGGMTVDEACDALVVPDDFTVTVTGRTADETITAEDIDLAARPDKDEIQQVLTDQTAEHISLALISQYFTPVDHTIDTTESYDETLAESCVDALECLNTADMVAPVDSEIAQNDDGTYYITDSSDGTTLDTAAAKQAILDAIAGEQTVSVDLESLNVYENAAITRDDEALNKELTELQTLTSACITYDFGDKTYVCDASVISTFLEKDENGDWSLNEDLVHDWVEQMASETDTYGKSHSFTTTAGTTIDLPNGNFGWRINRDSTTEKLVAAIKDGTVETREPVYNHYGMSRSGNDIGSSYVEVDLTNQTVYLYVKGSLILTTPCVSGLASSSERATPSNGVWAIAYKESPATLGTYEVQGYESHVTYWMPFNGGVGLHDADGWRSSYGGKIYKTNGSHGCINLPLSAAKTIYENVKAGWPVIVYGS